MVKAWVKLVAGSDATKTRLHDQLGDRIPLSRLLRNGPRALVTGMARLLFGYRAVRPWISYDAQDMLAARLGPQSRVLEFGSGMSTAWYSAHAGSVLSIEDHQPWFEKVQEILRRRGCTNVRYRLVRSPDEYVTLPDDSIGEGFDLIMIDGRHRDRCVDLAVRAIRPGGMIYLDNADKRGTATTTGNVPEARRKLLSFAEESGSGVTCFTDFAPTQLFVQTGIAVTTPSRPGGGENLRSRRPSGAANGPDGEGLAAQSQ